MCSNYDVYFCSFVAVSVMESEVAGIWCIVGNAGVNGVCELHIIHCRNVHFRNEVVNGNYKMVIHKVVTLVADAMSHQRRLNSLNKLLNFSHYNNYRMSYQSMLIT